MFSLLSHVMWYLMTKHLMLLKRSGEEDCFYRAVVAGLLAPKQNPSRWGVQAAQNITIETFVKTTKIVAHIDRFDIFTELRQA